MTASHPTRRALIHGAAATAAMATLAAEEEALAGRKRWAARPPAGFTRMSLPGKVVKVTRNNSLQANGAWPKQDAARMMLRRAMHELTGEADLGRAFAKFVHKDDTVAIKPNGIAGRKTRRMAASKELTIEVVKGVIAAGVPPHKITIYEQYKDFMWGTRLVTDKQLTPDPAIPKGVKIAVHLNKDAVMGEISVGGIGTKYVTPFTNATAVINILQVKDHSICGYTGAMKNITHGSNINPHDFHEHNASPQIAHLYAQDVVKSRVALHIADAFQVIYDGGPMDRKPKRRVKHEAVYASTDPVAIDVVGWKVVEKLRKDNGLSTLAAAGRAPSYLKVAGQLGLGVYDSNRIRVRSVAL